MAARTFIAFLVNKEILLILDLTISLNPKTKIWKDKTQYNKQKIHMVYNILDENFSKTVVTLEISLKTM